LIVTNYCPECTAGVEYDDVFNKQREAIYRRRKNILTKDNLKEEIFEMIEDEIKKVVDFHTQHEPWNYKEISEVIKSIFLLII